MADSLLILYNPDNKDQAQWVFINELGTPGHSNHGKLSELGQIARGYRTTLLIDSSHINLTQVNIPSQNRQRQLLAIPYALEDALADDIDELHFAAGKRQTDSNIPVITINRALLEEIISDFKDAGIFIETLSADALALPLNNHQWTLLLNDNHALIKTAAFTAYYCDLDILPVFLHTLINQQEEKPELILVYSSEQQAANIEQLNNIDIEIKSAIS
ncbi:MAG: type II secretion system protein GspL, partial [Gammaproteobacteria bacterium]|nr:type II secretion system protein GspL [Gammaproteobacteria bacterium]